MKSRKILSVLLSMALVFCTVFSVSTVKADDGITFDYSAETATLTVGGTGEILDYTENNLNSRPWAAFADSAETVVISEGITAIGDYAFSRFSVLTDVEIPDTVTRIGKTAFSGNDSLMSITIPSTVTTIEDYAFGFNFEMDVPDGFVAYCTANSPAVRYCVKNYVPFENPLVNGVGTAHITARGQQAMWSFVAPANGTVSFWSTGSKDVCGLIYDSSNYIFDESSFSRMKASAIAYNDDVSNSDVNFKVNAKVEAGKRYYLATKFTMNSRYDGSEPSEDGQFGVAYSFLCDSEAHNYEVIYEDLPTCEFEGSRKYQCKVCGYQYTEVLTFAEHTAGTPVEENRVEASCTVDGSYDEVVYCTVCTEEISRTQKTITATGHTFGEYVSNNDATCTDNATETANCENCEATDTREIPNSSLGHDYVPTVTQPTCVAQGYTTYNCSRCESSYVDNYTIPLGHTEGAPVEENRVEATCTVDGSYDEVIYCIVCTEELSRTQKTITATGHEYTITAFDGVTVVTTCPNCEDVVEYIFMDYFNTKVTEDTAILDVNNDGFINAKDFAKIKKDLAQMLTE